MSTYARFVITLAGQAVTLLFVVIGLATETANPFLIAIGIGVVTTAWSIVDLVITLRERRATQ